jgi:hypothetical protein
LVDCGGSKKLDSGTVEMHFEKKDTVDCTQKKDPTTTRAGADAYGMISVLVLSLAGEVHTQVVRSI